MKFFLGFIVPLLFAAGLIALAVAMLMDSIPSPCPPGSVEVRGRMNTVCLNEAVTVPTIERKKK